VGVEEEEQLDLPSEATDVGLTRYLLADLHDDLQGRIARLRQLSDLSMTLGPGGTMIFGGETAYAAWTEARASFIQGNYIATVLLCQVLAEHLLAAFVETGLQGEKLPKKVTFRHVLDRCLARRIVGPDDAKDLAKLLELRNPLTHYRDINDPTNLSRRAVDSQVRAEYHLLGDATFAINVAIRLLSLPSFRLSGRTMLDEVPPAEP
jgi:hypothetical protein